MKVYLFVDENKRTYGYHTVHVQGSIEYDASEFDLEQLNNNDGYLFYEEGRLVHRDDLEANDKRREQLITELHEIASWFAQNDWIPNKVVVGEWEPTDQRFIDYKAERLTKRVRQDEITSLLE